MLSDLKQAGSCDGCVVLYFTNMTPSGTNVRMFLLGEMIGEFATNSLLKLRIVEILSLFLLLSTTIPLIILYCQKYFLKRSDN